MTALTQSDPVPVPMARVLIVDDEEIVRAGLRRTLARLGYEPSAAANGQEALAVVSELKPAVIVLDLRMPAMDGKTFLRELALLPVDAAVVVVSGDGQMDDVIEVMRLGAVDFMRKPFTATELSAVVARALEIHGARRGQRVSEPTPTISVVVPRSPVRLVDGHASVFAGILARLQQEKLKVPSVPSVLTELRSLVMNPDASKAQVVGLVGRDQALSTRILQLGRSVEYSGNGKTHDLSSAIGRIGFRQILTMVEAIWMNGCFQNRDPRYLPYTTRLAKYSLARGIAMRALADLAVVDAEVAYFSGLMADLGASLLFSLLAEQPEGDVPEPEAALVFVQEHHEAVGARLLKHWAHAPPVVGVALRHHATGPSVPASPYWSLAVLASGIADELTGDHDLTSKDPQPNPQLVDRCAIGLGIGEAVKRKVTEQLKTEYRSVIEILS